MSRDKKSEGRDADRWDCDPADDDLSPEALISFFGLTTSYNFILRMVDNYIDYIQACSEIYTSKLEKSMPSMLRVSLSRSSPT